MSTRQGLTRVVADPPDSREAVQRIVGCIRDVVDPELILLFGSRASGNAAVDSDYDLMVVVADGSSGDALQGEIRSRLSALAIATDVLVRTAGEYVSNQRDPGLLDFMIARQGQLLFSSGRLLQRAIATGVRDPIPRAGLLMWMRRADSDFRIAEQSLEAPDPTCDAICFHAHACIEKLLKAAIVRGGNFPPRTHDLPALLGMQPESIRDNPVVADACALLMMTFPKARYPELPEPTAEEAAEAMAAARRARSILFLALGQTDGRTS